MEENPWKKIGTSEIYNNPWIRVKEDKVINPAGNQGIYGVVSFKNMAIGIIPVDQDRNTWLVGQYRYSLNEYSWEIPMGGGPLSVSGLESAKRELKEETGITARNWRQLLKIHTSNSVTDEVGYVYLATDLEFGETEFEETEILQIKKLPLKEAIQWAMEGKITDSVSLAALLKVGLLSEEEINYQ